MLHMVYHAELEPIIVETEKYHRLLESGEWYDNPNLKRGSNHEKETQLQQKDAKREKSKHEQRGKDAGQRDKSGTRSRKNDQEVKRKVEASPKRRGRLPKKK